MARLSSSSKQRAISKILLSRRQAGPRGSFLSASHGSALLVLLLLLMTFTGGLCAIAVSSEHLAPASTPSGQCEPGGEEDTLTDSYSTGCTALPQPSQAQPNDATHPMYESKQEQQQHQHQQLVGGADVAFMPSFGIFPHGCQWREVHQTLAGPGPVIKDTGNTLYNPTQHVRYQYWHDQQQSWTDEQPVACRLEALPKPTTHPGTNSKDASNETNSSSSHHTFSNSSPRTWAEQHKHHVVYHNLWYNNGHWYGLVDGDQHMPSWKFSR